MLFHGLGTIFILVAFVCHVIILIHAFKQSLLTFLACLCIPCYTIYYAFAKFEHQSKTLIILGYLFGNGIGASLNGYGYNAHSGGGDHGQHQQHR